MGITWQGIRSSTYSGHLAAQELRCQGGALVDPEGRTEHAVADLNPQKSQKRSLRPQHPKPQKGSLRPQTLNPTKDPLDPKP